MKRMIICFVFFSIVLLSAQVVWDQSVQLTRSSDKKICDVVASEDECLVIYQELNNELNYDLYFQKMNINGQMIGQNISIYNNNFHQRDAQMVKCTDNNYIVLWSEIEPNRNVRYYMHKINANGTFLWSDRKEVASSSESSDINQVHLVADQDGGAYVVWVRTGLTENFTIYFNHLDLNGNYLLNQQGQIFSNQNIDQIKAVELVGGELQILCTEFQKVVLMLLAYENQNPLINIGVSPNFSYKFIDFIVSSNQQHIILFTYNGNHNLLFYNSDHILSQSVTIDGDILSLQKLTDNEMVIAYVVGSYLNIIKYSFDGALISIKTINMLNDFQEEAFLYGGQFYNDMSYYMNQNFYLSFYFNTSPEFAYQNYQNYVLKYDLMNDSVDLVSLSSADYVSNTIHDFKEDCFKGFSGHQHYSLTFKYQPRTNYYNFSYLDLNQFNSPQTDITQSYHDECSMISSFQSSSVFNQNYFLYKKDNHILIDKINQESDINHLLMINDYYQGTQIDINQISSNHYILLHTNDIPYPYDYMPGSTAYYNAKVFNEADELSSGLSSVISDSNNDLLLDIEDDYTWISYKDEALNNYFKKISNGQIANENTSVSLFSGKTILSIYKNYVLFRSNGRVYISKLNEEGSIAEGWTEAGVQMPSVYSNHPIVDKKMHLTDQGLVVIWTEFILSSNYQHKTYIYILNPENAQIISNQLIYHDHLTYFEVFFNQNDLFIAIVKDQQIVFKRYQIASDNSYSLVWERTIDQTTQLYDVKVENERFVIAYGLNIDGAQRIAVRTLTFNGNYDQFSNGYLIPNVLSHQSNAEIVITENHQAFINRLEYDYIGISALYSDLINLNSFLETEDQPISQPESYQLNNYPNPFNPSTKISFDLWQDKKVSLGIYNIKGQLVKELNKGFLNKGHHEYQWDGKDQMGEMCASGVYFARLRSTSQSMIRKMLMIK